MPLPPEPTDGTVSVEVAWATPQVQDVVALILPADSTVAQAIAASGLFATYRIDVESVRAAVRGRLVDGDAPINDGDRIDLCRPLQVDPKEARRRRVAARLHREAHAVENSDGVHNAGNAVPGAGSGTVGSGNT